MLDLDPAVELEEEDVVSVDDELDRARAAIADRTTERDGRLVELLAKRRYEGRSRGLLEHLLVAPLHGAVPLAESDDVSMGVGEEVHLDVARALEVTLAVERPVAEGARRLAPGRRERVLELGGRTNDPHSSPSASRRRLD